MSKREIGLLICFMGLILAGCGPAKPAAPTIVPAITPIPGWHVLQTAGFQVWLPPSFVGGSAATMDSVTAQLTEKGPNYAKIPQALRQRGTPFIIFAVDTNSPPDKITYMLIDNEKLSQPLDIPGYLDLLAKNLTAQSTLFNILQKEVVPSDRYPTGKIVVELNTLESGDIKQVVYVLKNGGAIWQISFTSPTEEYDQRSGIFDQIARSANLPYIAEPTSPVLPINPGTIALIVVVLAIIGFSTWMLIKRRQKVEPVQTKKVVKKKKAKK